MSRTNLTQCTKDEYDYQVILNAIIKKASEHSFEAVSFKQIIKKASVFPATISYFTPSNQDLLSACCLLCLTRAFQKVWQPSIAHLSIYGGLQQMWLNYAAFKQSNPEDDIFLSSFFKAPSCFCDNRLKQKIQLKLQPLNDYLQDKLPENSFKQGIMVLNFLIDTNQYKKIETELEAGRHPDLLPSEFRNYYWPRFQKLITLPVYT